MAKTPSYEDNVFINCPFDTQYKPILNAIVFAIHDAGFCARCSLEVIDSGQTRLARLISIIAECKYGHPRYLSNREQRQDQVTSIQHAV